MLQANAGRAIWDFAHKNGGPRDSPALHACLATILLWKACLVVEIGVSISGHVGKTGGHVDLLVWVWHAPLPKVIPPRHGVAYGGEEHGVSDEKK